MIKKFNIFEDVAWKEDSFMTFEQAIEMFKKQYQKVLDTIQEHGFEVFKTMSHSNYEWKIVILLEKDNVGKSTNPTKDFIKLQKTIDAIYSIPILNNKSRVKVSSLHVEYYGEYKGHPYVEVYID